MKRKDFEGIDIHHPGKAINFDKSITLLARRIYSANMVYEITFAKSHDLNIRPVHRCNYKNNLPQNLLIAGGQIYLHTTPFKNCPV